MAGLVEGQNPGTAEAKPFHVKLEPNEPVSEPEDVTEPNAEGEDAESAKGQRATKAEPEDEGFPGDDIDYDPNDPAQKAAYEAFRKAMLPKWQKRVEALKKKGEAQGAQKPGAAAEDVPQTEAKAESGGSVVDDFYADPFGNEWNPGGQGFSKESDLAGYESELEAFVNERVKKAVLHTMQVLRDRGTQFEQATKEREAAGVIESYVKSLESHPDYDTLYKQLAEIAPGTKELAIRDPKKWVAMAAALTGVAPNWNESAGDESDEDELPQANVRRLATKPQAIVPRTQRSGLASSTPNKGTLRGDDAFEAAWKSMQRRG